MALSACPRCSHAFVDAPDIGAGVSRCSSCASFFLDGDARRHLTTWLRIDEEVWQQLLRDGGRGARCPGCGEVCALARLKGHAVDACASCGGMFLDPGELKGVSGQDEGARASAACASPVVDEGVYKLPGRVFAPPRGALQNFLGDVASLQVHEQVRTAQMMTSADLAERYVIRHPTQGNGHILRDGSDLASIATALSGGLLAANWTVSDGRENPILTLRRRLRFFVQSSTEVFVWNELDDAGRLGEVRAAMLSIPSTFELSDARGAVFARVRRPLLSLWRFEIQLPDGRVVGAIHKQGRSLFTEMFTDADDFTLDFGEHRWTLEQRAVLLACVHAIDARFFKASDDGGGSDGSA